MLRLDPHQRPRLVEIIRNLAERITEARMNGWLGEVQGACKPACKPPRTSWPASTANPARAPVRSPTSASPPSMRHRPRSHTLSRDQLIKLSMNSESRPRADGDQSRCILPVDDSGPPNSQICIAVRNVAQPWLVNPRTGPRRL